MKSYVLGVITLPIVILVWAMIMSTRERYLEWRHPERRLEVPKFMKDILNILY